MTKTATRPKTPKVTPKPRPKPARPLKTRAAGRAVAWLWEPCWVGEWLK